MPVLKLVKYRNYGRCRKQTKINVISSAVLLYNVLIDVIHRCTRYEISFTRKLILCLYNLLLKNYSNMISKHGHMSAWGGRTKFFSINQASKGVWPIMGVETFFIFFKCAFQ